MRPTTPRTTTARSNSLLVDRTKWEVMTIAILMTMTRERSGK